MKQESLKRKLSCTKDIIDAINSQQSESNISRKQMNKKEIKTIPLEYRHDIKFRDIPFERNIDGLKCYYNFSNENNQFVSEIFSDKSVKSQFKFYVYQF